MTYRITFAVRGRARFLSHLETVDTLLSSFRRAGYGIALSRGMKPRPVIADPDPFGAIRLVNPYLDWLIRFRILERIGEIICYDLRDAVGIGHNWRLHWRA